MWIFIIILAVILVVALILAFMRGVGKQTMDYEEAIEFQSHAPKEHRYKTPFDAKLIELGVKEKWDANYEKRDKYFNQNFDCINGKFNFTGFITFSFSWAESPEGMEFWYEISKK